MEKTCYTCKYNPELCPKTFDECSGKNYALWKPKDELKNLNVLEIEDMTVSEIKKCDQIIVLVKIAGMTLTEINTLTEKEKKYLSRFFYEQNKREIELMQKSK